MLGPLPRRVLGIAACAWLASVAPAGAESRLALDVPERFGVSPAITYDTDLHRVGNAEIRIEALPDGGVRLSSRSGYTGAARTQMEALLEPTEDGKLRPVAQRSRSYDPDEVPKGELAIDHRAGIARCLTPDGKIVEEFPLPDEDRVANVTLNLLFLPLLRGEAERVSFDLFFCSLGLHFVRFDATLAPASRNGSGRLREVRWGPDFGPASFVAAALVPPLAMWFEREAPYRWMAHRIPLYGGGPDVVVVREGVPTRWLDVH